MTPFFEQLGAGVALVIGLASVGAMIWGAATRQRGRQAVDDQHAGKLKRLKSSTETHSTACDDDRKTLDRRVYRIELELGLEDK